jgi:hypothetical protein
MDSIGEIAQLITAIVLAFNCWQSWSNGKKANKIAEGIHTIKENVITVEKATNSMKDALVAATAKASLAEGTAAGLKQGREEPRNTSGG